MRALGKLGIFALLFIAGNVLLVPLLAAAAWTYGISTVELMAALQDGQGEIVPGLLRLTFALQALALFIGPSLVFGWIFYRGKLRSYFDLDRFPQFWTCVVAMIVLVAAYPLVQLAYEVNRAIPLSDWMLALEDQAAVTLGELLVMDNFGMYLLTMLLIAVLPAVGEELVFRGIVQKQSSEIFRSQVAGVWFAAILFSLIHFQFGGFLPRVALGAMLGYLYLWTGKLWVPIFIHFVNNGFQITVMYYTGEDLSDPPEELDVSNWVIIVSVFGLYFAYRVLKALRNGQRTA